MVYETEPRVGCSVRVEGQPMKPLEETRPSDLCGWSWFVFDNRAPS